MSHLHSVPADGYDQQFGGDTSHDDEPDDTAWLDCLTTAVRAANDEASTARDLLDEHGADLDGETIVRLRAEIAATAATIADAGRLVDNLGNAWCWDHGTYPDGRSTTPVCRIGDDDYRPALAGSSRSLKVDGKRRITNEALRRVTDWGCRQFDCDPDDPSDENALTVKLLLSNVLGQLTAAFPNWDPARDVLAYDGDDPCRVPWAINVAAYETETASEPRKTFRKVQPKGDAE